MGSHGDAVLSQQVPVLLALGVEVRRQSASRGAVQVVRPPGLTRWAAPPPLPYALRPAMGATTHSPAGCPILSGTLERLRPLASMRGADL